MMRGRALLVVPLLALAACDSGSRKLAGDYRLRHQTPGADVDICFGGRIAITAIRLL